MMKQTWRAAAALLAALVGGMQPSAAFAREVVLQPAPDSRWIVNYGEASCRLLRDFGMGDSRVVMIAEQFEPGGGFGLVLAGAPLAEYARDRQVMLSFGPEGSELGERQIDWLRSNLGELEPAMTMTGVWLQRQVESSDDTPESEMTDKPAIMAIPAEHSALLDRVELRSGGDHLRLQVPRMGEALQTLNQCSQARLTAWGLDRDKQLTLTRRATADNLPEVARAIQRAYPVSAVRRGEQANLHLRMIVDEAGAVSDCAVTDVTQTQNIITAACLEFARLAQFQPALDAAGQPVKSFYTTMIFYRIGGEGSRRF